MRCPTSNAFSRSHTGAYLPVASPTTLAFLNNCHVWKKVESSRASRCGYLTYLENSRQLVACSHPTQGFCRRQLSGLPYPQELHRHRERVVRLLCLHAFVVINKADHVRRAMTHDPEVYPDPDEFLPSRFAAPMEGGLVQEPPAPDPRDVVFGFGRRACAGWAFADSNVWLAAAAIVATFTIDRVRDEHGREEIPSAEFTDGVVRCVYTYTRVTSGMSLMSSFLGEKAIRSRLGVQFVRDRVGQWSLWMVNMQRSKVI